MRDPQPVNAPSYADAFVKHPHKAGCLGDLFRLPEVVHVDRLGRVGGNGSIVAHDYRCNMRWDGCGARVIVTERAVRQLAVATEVRS